MFNWVFGLSGDCQQLSKYRDDRITRVATYAVHRAQLKPYAETVRFPLPISEDAQDRTILLPLYPQMTEPEQDQVIGALQEVLRHRTAGGSSGRVVPTAKTTKGDDSFRRSYERGGTASN